MFGTHFACFLLTYFWFYPPDEPPKNARMYRMCTDITRSRLTGETVRPGTRLTVVDISLLSRMKVAPCKERGYKLSEEDQKTLTVVRDGETNFLRSRQKLFDDPTMNYGSLIVKRAPVDVDFGRSSKDPVCEVQSDQIVDVLAPLKRSKEVEKEKKRKKQERMDALDQLTRGKSLERNNLFSRMMTDRLATSRKSVNKTQSVVSVTGRNSPYEGKSRKGQATAEPTRKVTTRESVNEDKTSDDKTLEREAKGHKLRPLKGYRNIVVNETGSQENLRAPKTKRSVMIKTLEDPTMLTIKTIEEPTKK